MMSSFEFVFTLLSVIASLGLAHIVAGVVHLVRSPGGFRPTWFHALWIWIAFATTVGNWGGQWATHEILNWPPSLVLFGLAVMIGQYVFCVLVIPEPSPGARPTTSQATEKTRYVSAFMGLILLALAANLGEVVRAGAQMLVPIGLCVIQLAVAAIALWAPWAWLRLAAAAMIAALSTFWMVVACEIVTRT